MKQTLLIMCLAVTSWAQAQFNPPVVTQNMDDTTRVTYSSPILYQLDDYFEDPDGGDLIPGVDSSDEGVATVSAESNNSGSFTVSVQPKAVGTSTITVTVYNGQQLEASQSFVISVVEPTPPVVTQDMNDTSQVKGSSPLTYYINDYFANPQGGELYPYALSSDESVATVSLESNNTGDQDMTLTPVGVGEATITVTVYNDYQMPVSQSFLISVVEPTPPVVTQTMYDTLREVGSSLTYHLGDYFEDPHSGELHYAVYSSDETVATVTLETIGTADQDMIVTPVNAGEATIRIIASNNYSEVEESFVITGSPRIEHQEGDFIETADNSGEVDGQLIMTIHGDTFVNVNSTLTLGTHFSIDNLPQGLTPIMSVSADGLQATLTLTGTANSHDASNSLSNLQVAFTGGAAFTIYNSAAQYSKVVFGAIEFIDSSSLQTKASFAALTQFAKDEAVGYTLTDYFTANEGTTITYNASSSNEAVASVTINEGSLSVTPVAEGEATITVTATTSDDQISQTLTVSVQSPYLTYAMAGQASEGFTEAEANDGRVIGELLITAHGDTFVSVGSTLTEGTHYTIDNLPEGLTPTMSVSADGSQATLILADQAIANDSSDNVADIQFAFTDEAFTTKSASDIKNATAANSGVGITFIPEVVKTVSTFNNFSVTVSSNGDNPTVSSEGDTEGPTVTKDEATGKVSVALEEVFEEVETLTLTAASGDESIATAEIVDTDVVVTPVGVGTTTIRVTAVESSANGRTQSVSVEFEIEVTDIVASIEDEIAKVDIVAYPNPTAGAFAVELAQTYERVTLQVSTLSGQVLSTQHYQHVAQLNATLEVPAGLYLLRIAVDNQAPVLYKIQKQ